MSALTPFSLLSLAVDFSSTWSCQIWMKFNNRFKSLGVNKETTSHQQLYLLRKPGEKKCVSYR